MSPEDFDQVRTLNDTFRRGCGTEVYDVLWHTPLFTRGREFQDALLAAIRAHENFDYDDFDLHDYGTVVVQGEAFQWRILYRLQDGSEADGPEAAERRTMWIEP